MLQDPVTRRRLRACNRVVKKPCRFRAYQASIEAAIGSSRAAVHVEQRWTSAPATTAGSADRGSRPSTESRNPIEASRHLPHRARSESPRGWLANSPRILSDAIAGSSWACPARDLTPGRGRSSYGCDERNFSEGVLMHSMLTSALAKQIDRERPRDGGLRLIAARREVRWPRPMPRRRAAGAADAAPSPAIGKPSRLVDVCTRPESANPRRPSPEAGAEPGCACQRSRASPMRVGDRFDSAVASRNEHARSRLNGHDRQGEIAPANRGLLGGGGQRGAAPTRHARGPSGRGLPRCTAR